MKKKIVTIRSLVFALASILGAGTLVPSTVNACMCFGPSPLKSIGPADAVVVGEVSLPVRYDEDRFFLEPVLEDGRKMVFYTDTGGGLFLYRESAIRFGLIDAGDEKAETARIPDFRIVQHSSAGESPLFDIFLLAKSGNDPFFSSVDGMLGQAWFADRIWTFDYPGRSLILRTKQPSELTKNSKRKVSLGFKTGEDGERVLNFPRIVVEIDGEQLDLLFDTGATTTLTENALKAVADGRKANRATSFITSEVFERWRSKHPEWKVVENAETGTGQAIIEVPRLKIAGHDVGPVWFTRRPDKNFHEYMSGFMDKRVEGAIGGNALREFVVTVDYPAAVALFERPKRK